MGGILDNALVQLAIVIIGVWVFVKFCTFAKRFSLPGKVKMGAYILTGLCVVLMNWLFSSAKHGLGAEVALTNPKLMTVTVLASFLAVLIFAFALMAETKS